MKTTYTPEQREQLNAAAPDLLAALQGIAEYVHLWAKPGTTAEEIYKRATAAIAKATE